MHTSKHTSKQSFPPDFVYLLHAAATWQTAPGRSSGTPHEEEDRSEQAEDENDEMASDDARLRDYDDAD